MSYTLRCLLWGVCLSTAFGQTMVDLRTQSKRVDFSEAISTQPFKSGTVLPSVCSVGEMFYKTDALPGANLYGCVGLNAWARQGAGGGSMLAQTGDLVVARNSATVLSIGANCSAASPCNVRFGGLYFSVISSASATLNSGTGVAFIYVTSTGTLTVGHNVDVSCTANCSALSGITAFPADSIPLFTWSATNGTWDTNGGADRRAFLSTKIVQSGAGLSSVESGGKTVLSADPVLVGVRTTVPASSSAGCTTGSWAMDTAFYYLCVSSGSWRRVALSSW